MRVGRESGASELSERVERESRERVELEVSEWRERVECGKRVYCEKVETVELESLVESE